MVSGSPLDVEALPSLGESLGLMLDGILLDANAATAIRPVGLLNGISPLTPVSGGGLNALLGDVRQLTATIAPALRPTSITGPVQAASLGLLAPNSTLAVLAPRVAAGTVAMIEI
jgi:hypothetical protein